VEEPLSPKLWKCPKCGSIMVYIGAELDVEPSFRSGFMCWDCHYSDFSYEEDCEEEG